MAKRKSATEEVPMGTILFENLERLGYVDRVARSSDIARLVVEKTGRSMSRQRVLQLLNAVKINAETIELLAKGLGVTPEDLTTRPVK